MSEIKISLFKPSKTKDGYKPGTKPLPTDFYTEMSKIQDGTHYEVIKKLREINDPVEKRAYKVKNLEGFTVSAVCPSRREIKGAVPSGLMSIDIDGKENPTITDWNEVRDMLFEMPEVVSSFVSASGNGCAFVVKIDPKKFKDTYYSIKDELEDNFSIKMDAGCGDISRLRFVSHDHDLKVRDRFDDIPVKLPSPAYLENKKAKEARVIEYTGEIGDANCERAWSYAVKAATQKVGVFADGTKHSYLVALAGFCNTVGMSQQYCESMVRREYLAASGITTERLLKPIQNVYRQYKHKFDTYKQDKASRVLNSKIVGEVVNNYIRKGVKEIPAGEIAEKLEANIDRVNDIIERVSNEYKEEHNLDAKAEAGSFKQFWFADEDNAVNISKILFRDFLRQKGVERMRTGNEWILIRIQDNIVTEIQKDDVKEIVFSHLEKMKEFEVMEVIANRITSMFANDYLEILPAVDIKFYRDPKDKISLFYNNGVVEIKSDDIVLKSWSEFEGKVWSAKVLDRPFSLIDFSESINNYFITFLDNITKNDPDRLAAICSSMAYLIHGYKDKSIVQAVIVNDEVISDNPEGGSGKGMLFDAVGQIKKITMIDGKDFDFSSQFKYQRVELDTDIVVFDDVNKDFKFEKLFSTLTGGMTVEKKGGHQFKFDFKQSPKVGITTNYAIQGEGSSFERRKNELEIANYYSADLRPIDEYGKQLFDDFDPEEWNGFDNFICRACAVYLRDGLVKQKLVNQPIKQVYAAISKEVFDFMDSEYNWSGGSAYNVIQMDAFNNYNRVYQTKMGAKKFFDCMDKFYRYKQIPFHRKKSGDNWIFRIGETG